MSSGVLAPPQPCNIDGPPCRCRRDGRRRRRSTRSEIIVVDDSDADLLYTRIVLEGTAGDDSVLTTGAEALEHLQRSQGQGTDLILLDINMPEMNGFEFLQAYEGLEHGQHARAVVVMLSSSSDPGEQKRAFAFSCVKDYIVKPLDPARARRLMATVGRWR